MGPENEWTRADIIPSSSSFVIEDHVASTSGSAAGPYIEHIVTRLDTLAGVAIKYGVEVADIKRLNGLTTDLQMFALKTLRIPTPGRHPPGSRGENVPSTSHHDLGFSSSKAALEKMQETPTMALLRDYYGLPADTGKEGIEMATINLDKETTDNAAFLPMHCPPHSWRHSIGAYRTCGYTRESCNNLLGSCWSTKPASESSLLMKPSKERLREGDLPSKERPIRRRTRDDSLDVGEKVNLPRRKDLNSSEGPSGIKSIGAALLGRKEAVEGLLSKVITPAASQDNSGRPLSERVPSTGSFSLFEGLTSAYRNAKAALD